VKVYHFYGMTASTMGLPEREFIEANSKPSHSWNECLRRMKLRRGLANRLYLYTLGSDRRTVTIDGLDWVLVPATWGARYGAGAFGRLLGRPHYQFSLPLLREVENNPPDLFVFYGNVPTPFSVVIARRLRRMGVPYAVTVHTTLENLFLKEVSSRPARRFAAALAGAPWGREAPILFSHAAAVILLTGTDREAAIRRGLAPAERIHVIPSGINGAYFHPGRDEERGPYPSLCFVGRLEDAKGFLEAVRCLAAVKERLPDARLHAAGAWTSDPYKDRVLGFIEEKGLRDAVVFHGWLAPKDLGDLYRQSHLLLFPSRREGLPRAVLEAMVCGAPAAAVLGTGGHGEVIVHEENGLLAPRDDWEDAVVRLLVRRDPLRAMAERATRLVRESYSLDAMIERVEKLYLSVISRVS
jgi:glycosyltransferase involved in cell wall biosynthesis